WRTLDRVLRDRLLGALEGPSQKAYDARHDIEVERLTDLGTRAALERCLADAPGSSRAAALTMHLAELDLEAGEIDLATSRLEAALAMRGLAAEDAERARIQLPALYALEGRRRDCADALAALDGDTETKARRLAALAAQASDARRADHALVTSALATARWTHENYDWYEDSRGGPSATSEPACDASRVYAHDGSHCVALALDTGKLVWRTPLREEGVYRAAFGPCRVSLSESVVACALPWGDLVTLDRATSERLATISVAQIRAATGGTETTTYVVESLLAHDVLVVGVLAQDSVQE